MSDSRSPHVDKGHARSVAFVFGRDRLDRPRHAAITVNRDGSGHLAIYDSRRGRLLASRALDRYDQFRAIRDAIDAHAASHTVEALRRAGETRRVSPPA